MVKGEGKVGKAEGNGERRMANGEPKAMANGEWRMAMAHSEPPGKHCNECANAQLRCREMRRRNINKIAMSIGDLYTHVTEFRISDMFLGAYIHSAAWIVAHRVR
jgi:hypothetical protein